MKTSTKIGTIALGAWLLVAGCNKGPKDYVNVTDGIKEFYQETVTDYEDLYNKANTLQTEALEEADKIERFDDKDWELVNKKLIRTLAMYDVVMENSEDPSLSIMAEQAISKVYLDPIIQESGSKKEVELGNYLLQVSKRTGHPAEKGPILYTLDLFRQNPEEPRTYENIDRQVINLTNNNYTLGTLLNR